MEKAYKYRIYPNKEQEQIIQETFGCCRFVFNYYLDKWIKVYEETKENYNFFTCCKDLTLLKQEKDFLKDIDRSALEKSLKNLDNSYNLFFKGEEK